MAITFNKYTSYKDDLLGGNIDLANDTIKVALTTSAYTPSAAHDFFDDITNEITGTGYTAGGATLANASISAGVFDADDTAWTSATFTARYGIVYKDTGVAGTSPLIGYIDFDADQSPADQTFKIVWNAGGIITIS